jgi:NAD(P)-dependent dehydrogenase (short-subunit alcohol dehydrogenase family)
MAHSLKNKVAIVTGSGRGIGAAIAKQLAKAGTKVVVNYLEKDFSAAATLEEIENAHGNAILFKADVRQDACVENLVQKAIAQYGGIDILVHCAHTPFQPKFKSEVTQEEIDEQIEGKAYSAMRCMDFAAPYLKQSNMPVVLNLSSISVRLPDEMFSHRDVANLALERISQEKASVFSKSGIRVKVLRPGWTSTDQVKEFTSDYLMQKAVQSPLGRFFTREEVANAALKVILDDSQGLIFELYESLNLVAVKFLEGCDYETSLCTRNHSVQLGTDSSFGNILQPAW